MPTSTGTLDTIASFTLSQGLQKISFSNLPQNYQTLVLSIQGDYTNSTQSYCRFWMNGNNTGQYRTNSYVLVRFLPNGGTPAIDWSQQNAAGSGYTNITPDAGTRSLSTEMTMINYPSTAFYKTVIFDSRMNSTIGGYGGYGLTSVSTEEFIKDFTIQFDGGTFSVGTQFVLYGISSHQIKATGGDVIWSDGTYWYHTFLSSGTFTPVANMNIETVVVAGGGAGGGFKGAGGGAGGLLYHSSKSLTGGTSYPIVIGAGGSGNFNVGSNGSNTTFSDMTAIGGGGGGSDQGGTSSNGGLSGGSGGGATRGGSAGAATQGNSGGATGYGFAGGVGANGTYNIYGGGGGGGSNQIGQSPTSTGDRIAGDGGDGRTAYSAWQEKAHIYFAPGAIAGGGGGSSYSSGDNVQGGRNGNGGGGTGATYNTLNVSQKGLDATANSGGGGGGGADQGAGGAGASGVVMLRYTV